MKVAVFDENGEVLEIYKIQLRGVDYIQLEEEAFKLARVFSPGI